MPMSSFAAKGASLIWGAGWHRFQTIGLKIAAITIAELWHGVERAAEPQKSKRRKYLETVVAALPIVPYTEQTAYEHARIWAELQSAGKNDRFLRSDRGGYCVGTGQPCGHIQQTAFRAGQGTSYH
jgi:predicted nucleic acid-binding protein